MPALLGQLRRTKRPVRITRFGKAVAEVVPPAPAAGLADWLGLIADTMEIPDDIVSPVIGETDWGGTARLKLLVPSSA